MGIKIGVIIRNPLREQIYKRANGQCECKMGTCDHPGRCAARLRGEWQTHRMIAGGKYIPSNVLAMCQECHRDTPSYGVGKR